MPPCESRDENRCTCSLKSRGYRTEQGVVADSMFPPRGAGGLASKERLAVSGRTESKPPVHWRVTRRQTADQPEILPHLAARPPPAPPSPYFIGAGPLCKRNTADRTCAYQVVYDGAVGTSSLDGITGGVLPGPWAAMTAAGHLRSHRALRWFSSSSTMWTASIVRSSWKPRSRSRV